MKRLILAVPTAAGPHLWLALACVGFPSSGAEAAPLGARAAFLSKLRQQVSSDTASIILDRAAQYRLNLTRDQMEELLKASLTASGKRQARSGFTWQFEAANGKLKFGSDRKLTRHVTVGHREVNVYHTAAGAALFACLAPSAAATVVSLAGVSEAQLRRCVQKATDVMVPDDIRRNF
jgi:hypothetical protein